MSAAQFPFDSRLRVEDLSGLDKLRAVPDRGLAEELFRLWEGIERAEATGETGRWKLEEQRRKEREEMVSLEACAKAAFDGAYGAEGKALAAQMLVDDSSWGKPRRTDARSLEAFRDELRRLRINRS